MLPTNTAANAQVGHLRPSHPGLFCIFIVSFDRSEANPSRLFLHGPHATHVTDVTHLTDLTYLTFGHDSAPLPPSAARRSHASRSTNPSSIGSAKEDHASRFTFPPHFQFRISGMSWPYLWM